MKTWSRRRLLQFGKRRLSEANVLERRSTVLVFNAGQALLLARPQFKHGEWLPTLEKLRIPKSNASEAMLLAERAKNAGNLRGLTLTEAKRKYDIYPAGSQTQESDSATASNAAGENLSPSDKRDGVEFVRELYKKASTPPVEAYYTVDIPECRPSTTYLSVEPIHDPPPRGSTIGLPNGKLGNDDVGRESLDDRLERFITASVELAEAINDAELVDSKFIERLAVARKGLERMFAAADAKPRATQTSPERGDSEIGAGPLKASSGDAVTLSKVSDCQKCQNGKERLN